MWNSSRRIALTGTAVALTAGGLVGLAWMADWLPIEFGEAPSGEVSEFAIDDIDFRQWEVGQADSGAGPEESPWSDDQSPEEIFAGQSEPGFSEEPSSSPREFVSRADWTSAAGSPGVSPRTVEPSGVRTASASIPEEFPSFEELKRRGATRAIDRGDRVNLDTEPHQVLERSPFDSESTAAPRTAPRFDSTADSLSQAREFPDSVAVLDRNRAPAFDDPNSTDPGTAVAAPAETTPAASTRTATNITESSTAAPESRREVGTELDLTKIDAWLKAGDYVSAHRDLSKIYWNHPESRRYIQERLNSNAKLIYFSPQPHFLEPYVIQSGDYLQKIAPKYGISWQYLANMNAINPRRIRVGQKLKVIKGPFSVFVDLSDFELTVHCHGFYVKRYTIGIGKDGASPQGKFTVLNKVEKAAWTDPNGNVVPGDDSTNPLGSHWIDIGDGFGIHGTIEPDSIGKAESRGCIRMRNSDVKEVYDFLLNGSEVVIRP
jgi:LysM repeat protein